MNATTPAPQSTKPPITPGTSAFTRGLRAACVLSAAALLLAPGSRAQTDAPKPALTAKEDAKPGVQTVRQKYVPLPPDPARGNGADWSAFQHFADDDPDTLMLMAHAGVGDSFPVQEEDMPKAMDVKIVAGNDDELELAFVPAQKPEAEDTATERTKMKLRRDHTEWVVLHGYGYKFSYPSVRVASDGKATTEKPMLLVHRTPLNSAFTTTTPKGTLLYNVRFSERYNHGSPLALTDSLRRAFPKDSIITSPSATNVRLSDFEVRNLTLKELARTIEFLSEGKLAVEVVEKEGDMPGNIWRIGGKSPTAAAEAPSLKMRSVAAPHLFGDAKKVERMMKDASSMEDRRVNLIMNSAPVRNGEIPRVAGTQIEPLPEQKVFVLIGAEEGVAGMESLIKAAEQLAADDDAKMSAERMADEALKKQDNEKTRAEEEAKTKADKQRKADEAAAKEVLAASLAPKMKAVAAPHLFSDHQRLDQFMDEAKKTKESWYDWHMFLMKEAGSDHHRHVAGGETQIQPHPEQKVFILLGSEEGIAGMESLIKAAEQIAVDEDAKNSAQNMAGEARDAELKAEALRQKALDDKYPKGTKQNP